MKTMILAAFAALSRRAGIVQTAQASTVNVAQTTAYQGAASNPTAGQFVGGGD